MLFRISLIFLAVASLRASPAFRGADIPWTTYEAEAMATTGEKRGPKYEPNLVETEASGQKCVKLAAGQHVEFIARESANTLIARYSLPDAQNGGGIDSAICVLQNGRLLQKLTITSRYSWIYGQYPFSNNPKSGAPRNFYDEVRVKGLTIAPGDVLRLQLDPGSAADCFIDLVDLEKISPPLAAPPGSLAITDARFGAVGDGVVDATAALKNCVAAAKNEARTVWVPAGDFKITGDIDVPAGVTIQGAGMWHTTFVGDSSRYGDAGQRVRFNGCGGNIRLSDFAIVGKLDYRSDREPNDGIGGWFGVDSAIARVWVEHTKAGVWVNNSSNLVIEGCRFRNTLADGANLCVGVTRATLRNCTARGTGDDCFAIWPATFARQKFSPGFNLITRCTGQSPFLGNGAALYGGEGNRIEDCRFTDILSGCAILLSTTFPTADEKKGIDNNFCGLTVVQGCDLVRSGGFDPWRTWRAALQICLDRRNISGVEIRDLNIKDSISDGLSIVGPGNEKKPGVLSHARLAGVNIPNCGIGAGHRHGLWVRNDVSGSLSLSNSTIVDLKNNAAGFVINQEPSPAPAALRQPVAPPAVIVTKPE